MISSPGVKGKAPFVRIKIAERLEQAILAAQDYLLGIQVKEGFWSQELAVDITLCADWILTMHWSGRMDDSVQKKCAAQIRKRQLKDGGWNIYHGGPAEVNASVKGYFALKLAGVSPDEPAMIEAKTCIEQLGGIPAMNTYSKLYLALLGQFPWEALPMIPLEIMLFPQGFFFNLQKVSAWSRTMLVPLAIINHFKPTRSSWVGLEELFRRDSKRAGLALSWDRSWWSWRNFFLFWDRALKLVDRLPAPPWRGHALDCAEKWMTTRMGPGCDGLGAIFPAMLNGMIALQCLGYEEAHPLVQKTEADLRGLFLDEPGDFRIQPCLSPVWDTAINLIALRKSGVPAEHPALLQGARWLLEKEVRTLGDWADRVQGVEPSGWAFEFNNVFYPDTDDTMMVLMALEGLPVRGVAEARERALRWLLAMQCRGGGWAAFDRDVTQRWLEDVPFADHQAILDPECSDLTARALETLATFPFDKNDRAIRRVLDYLRRTQEADGSWYGRWGVNYIYGTWQVLRGLAAFGHPMEEPWLLRARDWLEKHQNPDGSWGETAGSYTDPKLRGRGPGTPSQTAWALMGLCASHGADWKRIERGVEYLLARQLPAGDWLEAETTGTGFPGVFYLRYDSYRINWPLLALAEARALIAGNGVF